MPHNPHSGQAPAAGNPYQSPPGTATPSSPPRYRTAPDATQHMPPGIPYIVGNEAAERFSYYGMRTILVVFMTTYLRGGDGGLATMSEPEAKAWYHLFTGLAYAFPLAGALLADGVLGKYRTIIWLSIIYCLGHLALALDETRLGLTIGLLLIAVGAGGIKPCVSAHVGDQFGKSNQHLLSRVFGWFYLAINLGAFASSTLTPLLLDRWGPQWAFGVPGVLMLLATIVFWMGRWKFVHIPPGGMQFVREALSGDGLRAIMQLSVLYVFVAVFWALYDQTGSAWVLQADKMDRMLPSITIPILGWSTPTEVLAAQVQAVNPLLILLLVPIYTYGIYPAAGRFFTLTSLRKVLIGFFLAALSFAFSALIQSWIDRGLHPHVAWQVANYVVITAAEVMVSITCLEYSYTQAPKTMKSLIMGLYFLSVSLGNVFTGIVNFLINRPDNTSRLTEVQYYGFFALLMLATAVIFIFVVARYKERTYIQDEAVAEPETQAT